MTTDLMESLFERINRLRKKQLSFLTAEQAKEYGFELEPDWSVEIDWEAEEPKYTYISPEKWKFSDLVYGTEGELQEYTALSPEGKTYTKTQLETLEEPAVLGEIIGAIPSTGEVIIKTAQGLETRIGTQEEIAQGIEYATQREYKYQPKAVSIPPTETYDIGGLLQKVYPEKFQPGVTSWGLTVEELVPVVTEQIQTQITEDWEGFLKDLQSRGDTVDTRALLKLIGGEEVTEDIISQFFEGIPAVPIMGPEETQFRQNLMAALPLIVKPTTIDWAEQYFGKNPDLLRRQLITAGRNPDTEALVKFLYPQITDRGLEDYFSPRVPRMEEFPIVSGGAEIITEPVTFWENPALWWRQQGERAKEREDLDATASAIRQATLANTPGIIGLVNRPIWQGGLSATDIVGIGLLAYVGYEAAKVGWDFFLRSSLLRNLNSWLESAGRAEEVTDAEKKIFIDRLMPYLNKKWLSIQTIKTIFNPTKAGLRATPETVNQAEADIVALVQREAPIFIPLGTQTGALAFGGLPPKLTAEIWNIIPVAQRVANATSVGLSGTVGSKAFEQLTPAEITALSKAIPAEVTPVPEVTKYEEVSSTGTLSLKEVSKYETRIPLDLIRKDEKQTLAKLTEEIKKEGIKEPIVIRIREDGSRVVWDGIHRFIVAQDLGIKDIPVRFIGGETQKGVKPPKIPPTKPPTPEVAIPKAEVGMPEAGLQPTMIPEVTAKEVRPRGKGEIVQISMEEQLKLEKARREAEGQETAGRLYEADMELAATKEWLITEPAARLTNLIKKTGWYKGEVKNLTLKQYRDITGKTEIKPNILTADKKHVKWEYALDDIATELGYADSETLKAEIERAGEGQAKIKELQKEIARLETEKPLETLPEPKEISLTPTGEKALTPAQVEKTLTLFGLYVESPTAINAWELTRELRRETRTGQAELLKARTQELIVTQGVDAETGMRQAIQEILSGELPVMRTDYLDDLTNNMRAFLFNKVYETLKDEPFEMASTLTALTNALLGKPIPREPGIKGGSAYTRLQHVFTPGVFKAIQKGAKEGKSLQQVIEGLYEIVGQPPIPVDQATADYLRGLAEIPLGQARLGGKPFIIPSLPLDTRTVAQKAIDLQNFKLELTPDIWKGWTPERLEEMSYLRVNLLKVEYQTKLGEVGWTPPAISDKRTPAQRALELDLFKIEMAKAPIPVAPYEAPIEDAIKQIPLLPRPVMDNVIRVLKELGMLPVDIGNFLRANKASFDFSFWRQQAPLIVSHPIAFVQSNIEAWKAIWSQKSAEASWQRITRDPIYQIYEECERNGGDFLRPLELKKGTAQWRGVEEYGYLTGERLIPRLTAKIPWVKLSARSFETGTNVHNWLIFKSYYNAMLRYSEQIASGEKILKAGEAFNITKEMVDFSKSLANFSARGSLGKFAATAPELSGLFFAPRAAIGRILSVKDLINANPKVRLEAWKNAALFVSTFGGIVLLGAAMGWWEVETDPRSAEYMSIRIGNTRIDPWGGFRQFLVFFARAITGTGVSSVTGAEYKVDPINLIQTFIRGKASPLASLILDFWRGKNFVGEEVDVANKRQWVERLAPFAVWDIYEAYIDDPITGLQVAIPAIVGAGVQTYTGDWKENYTKLGLPKYSENLIYGLTEPRYNLKDFWSDTVSQFKDVDPASLTEQRGYPAYIRDMVETKRIQEQLETIPSEKLVNLNADPSKDEPTFAQYYQRWRQREALVNAGDEAVFEGEELQPDGTYKTVTYKGDDAITAFDKKYPRTYLGNMSQRQFALLNEYWLITDKKKQANFLEKYKTEIGTNLRDAWLRSHPTENARLALYGQADILTKEAYNQYMQMLKTLDYPELAIPEMTLPPEASIDTHFTYEDMVSEGTQGSWEAQLLLKQDAIKAEENGVQSYADWRGLKLSDIPIASLEIKTKPEFGAIYDKIEALGDNTSPDYIADEKARAEAINNLKTPQYIDDTRRIEAIEKGTDDNPISDTIIKSHVEYGRIQDKEGIGSSSAESMLYRVDNPEYDKFRIDEIIFGDNALKPIDESRIPIWRIDVKYAKEDAEYNAIQNPLPVEQARLRDEYMVSHPEYRIDNRKREAYSLTNSQTGETFPRDQVKNYVSYYEIPNIREGKRQERFIVNNTVFAQAMYRITGKDIWLTKPEDVPNVAYDDIYDQYKDLFDEMRDNSDSKSPYYIKDKKEREARDKQIFDENPAFKEAYYRRKAYGELWDEKYVNNYATYMLLPEKGYAKERFLKEHQDFYLYAKNKLGWIEVIDFSKIPSEKIEKLYNEYQTLPKGKAREDFRYTHQDLDAWLVLVGKVSKSITEIYRIRELTPKEKFAEEATEADIEFDKMIEELRKRLERLGK